MRPIFVENEYGNFNKKLVSLQSKDKVTTNFTKLSVINFKQKNSKCIIKL